MYVITVNNHTGLGKMGLVNTGIVRKVCSCQILHNVTSRRQWKLCVNRSIRPMYQGADKLLARSKRKQARKHARDTRDFNKIETRTVIKFLSPQGKAQKEIHTILTETLACFLPGRAKDLSAVDSSTSPHPINDGSILTKIRMFDWGDTAIVLNPINMKSEGGFTLHM